MFLISQNLWQFFLPKTATWINLTKKNSFIDWVLKTEQSLGGESLSYLDMMERNIQVIIVIIVFIVIIVIIVFIVIIVLFISIII